MQLDDVKISGLGRVERFGTPFARKRFRLHVDVDINDVIALRLDRRQVNSDHEVLGIIHCKAKEQLRLIDSN